MVFFTCQHCGEPVKKASVEKHYNTKCRFKSPNLTCVDCLKDFSNDYDGHNQCMTEEQRYSASGTVFKEQKGKKKQEEYIEMVQKILSSRDLSLSPAQRKLLEFCSRHDNIPRKAKPFENFVKNAARQLRYGPEDIHVVFNTIEDAWKKKTQPKRSPTQEKETSNLQEESNGNETLDGKTHSKTNGNTANDDTNSDTHKKSKKRRNSEKSLGLVSENDVTIDVKTSTDGNEKVTTDIKAKKKKRDKSLITNDTDKVNGVANSESIEETNQDVHNSESSKTKKKKEKGKSLCLDNEDEMNVEKNDDSPSSGKDNDSKCVNIDDIKENVNKISKKQLKKQKKYEKYLAELECEAKSELNKNTIITDVEQSNEIKQKKKKSKKIKPSDCDLNSVALTEDKNAVNVTDLSMNTDSKKNKKRKLEQSNDIIPEKKMKELSEEGEQEPSAGVFHWGDVIMNVLQSRPDKELSLKKLGKKVVNEYQSVKQDHRTYEELLTKFNKKVTKVKGVRVVKDRAKLIE